MTQMVADKGLMTICVNLRHLRLDIHFCFYFVQRSHHPSTVSYQSLLF